jgi:geranylgeranyl pyrophosphate synthase
MTQRGSRRVDVHAYMAERGPMVEAELDRLLPPASEAPQGLHAAMRHLVFPAGKRFRPILAIAGAEAVAGRPEDALPVAVAVELIHTYTLIHDDLPCMDDDAERRGRPTVHIAHGEALAVLAGDALQSLAFEALAESANESNAPRVAVAVGDLARAIGSRQLVGGQADDLEYDPNDVDWAHVESVHSRKSAALIATSITGGARLAAGHGEVLKRLEQFMNGCDRVVDFLSHIWFRPFLRRFQTR